MSTNLLQSLQIFTEFVVQSIGEKLRVFPIDNILLSVQEPFGDFVLCGVLKDSDNTLELFGSKFSGTAY